MGRNKRPVHYYFKPIVGHSLHNECVILWPQLKYQSDDGAESMIKGKGGVWGGTFLSDLEKKGVCGGPVQGAVLA